MALFALCLALVVQSGPVEFGRGELNAALRENGLAARGADVTVRVSNAGEPESYVLRSDGRTVEIVGADAAGAMYGELEMAERVRLKGVKAWAKGKVEGKPFLRDRGLNVFLTLPWNYEKNDTDYDVAALTDPNRWWFQNDAYMQRLLDSMARARMNWLDIHGTWDISVTNAPNLYAYFIQSDKYPKVGVPPEVKAKNLAQLNKVIDMAHARGIRVSLMAYEARLRIPQNPEPPYPNTEAVAYDYTKEMVEKMIRQAPNLDALGYRIGESGKGESFFTCYQEAVKASGRDLPLLTRTWITRKSRVLPLAEASNDYSTQIKYNGEQWGVPYMAAGGRMPGWYSYSFEDYLSYSGDQGAKMWPGNPTEDGGTWPAEPYKPIWQVRLNGTHRIFPFYQPEWVRRTIEVMKVGAASGYTTEPINAYYPKSPRYYVADPNDLYTEWGLDRDEPFIMLWGRYGYDPKTPESAFQLWFTRFFGKQGALVAKTWQTASKIVPTAYSVYSLGPDHRSQSPEMELGGTIADYIEIEPFDEFVATSVKCALSFKALGAKDGRTPNFVYAQRLSDYSSQVRKGLAKITDRDLPEVERKRLKELRTAMLMLSHLADYYAARLESAYWQGLTEAGDGDHRGKVAAAMERAVNAWRLMSDSPEANYYKPYTEKLRMHVNDFHWRQLLPTLDAMRKGLPMPAPVKAKLPGFVTAPASAVLSWRQVGGKIVCTIPAKGLTAAWLLHKPLPSTTYFHKLAMERKGDVYEASIERLNAGHQIAADVELGGKVARTPYWEKATPYLVVPSLPKPTPRYYSSEEAMAFFKPESLTPEKYGTILLPTRSLRFFRLFDMATKRKILDPVERGMRLVILQQDYLGDKYPLTWLPTPPKVKAVDLNVFDPAGALGLPKVEAPGILWQVFQPTPGWEIFGNGGVARFKLGKGEIWLIQARAYQWAHVPSAAKLLATVVSLDKSKPVVVLDHCAERAEGASAYFTDLMNAVDVPFVTLGEVIAEEQGMDSFERVQGKVTDDTVLDGRGAEMVKAFLSKKARAAAARPLPTTKEQLESDKMAQKKELMRCLGLDPLPERTPLNAKVTGVIQRKGYRLEKIVFESRPGFPVTGHLYIPDGPAGTKYPVILNPHGHWGQKKMQPTVQYRLISQALAGYVAFIIDTPGESWEGENLVERRQAGSHWDFALTVGSANTTAIYVWDQMRALDYLETRPEADMARVGLTGASGGGLATMYEFAADERIKCAVPVVYASSLEIVPDNGCACNHVPGVLQIGDRSDVIALRAPTPVYLIGAEKDGEFPAEGMKLSGEKLAKIYGLYGAAERTGYRIFEGGHDYNKPMREQAMGFFDRWLKGKGDGSPVPEPEITTEDPADPQFLCMPEVPAGGKTMRDVARENLAAAKGASWDDVVKLNGGIPAFGALNYKAVYTEAGKSAVVFQSESGLTVPGLLWTPKGAPKAAIVLVSEGGKVAAQKEYDVPSLVAAGHAVLAIDVRGTGELAGLDIRLMTYLGTAPAFAQAVDVVAAVSAMKRIAPKVAVIGSGLGGAQVPLYAALMEPSIAYVAGLQGMRSFADELSFPLADVGVNHLALTPRANYGATLDGLKAMVKCPAHWSSAGDKAVDLRSLLEKVL